MLTKFEKEQLSRIGYIDEIGGLSFTVFGSRGGISPWVLRTLKAIFTAGTDDDNYPDW